MQARLFLHPVGYILILGYLLVLAIAEDLKWPEGLPNTGIMIQLDDLISSRLPKRAMQSGKKKGQFAFISNNKLGPPPESLPYRFDDSGGKNVAIYVIDASFKLDGVKVRIVSEFLYL